jgi:hypothetical protein
MVGTVVVGRDQSDGLSEGEAEGSLVGKMIGRRVLGVREGSKVSVARRTF